VGRAWCNGIAQITVTTRHRHKAFIHTVDYRRRKVYSTNKVNEWTTMLSHGF
jgi:hypothetical protein